MKYKTLARLLVKFLGVYILVCIAGNSLLLTASETLGALIANSGSAAFFGTWQTWITTLSYSLTAAAVGLYFFCRPNWLTDKLIPSNRPYCPHCDYDLTGNHSPQCPECGTPLPPITEKF